MQYYSVALNKRLLSAPVHAGITLFESSRLAEIFTVSSIDKSCRGIDHS